MKIGDVLSNVFGVSGQAILEALLENKRSATEIAELAHWRLAPKIPQIVEALEGHRMRDHHRLLIKQSLDHMQYIEKMIRELDTEIGERLRPYQKQIELACTVPGIGVRTDRSRIAIIWRPGRRYVPATMRAPVNEKAAGRGKATVGCEQH